jgi:hypothetical protein
MNMNVNCLRGDNGVWAKQKMGLRAQGKGKKENLLAKSRTFTYKHTMKQWSPPSWFLYALFTF